MKGVRSESGAVIVVAIVFVMIFLILGVALYWLVSSQTQATELERTDIKAFNVAEAGVDAGMLALKLDWPQESPGDPQLVDNDVLKTAIQADEEVSRIWDPSRSDPTEFIQVAVYDNVDENGDTTTVPNPDPETRVYWDSNDNGDGTFGDGMMFVDSSANVDDDRHRILILAQQQIWPIDIPYVAMCANSAGGNGSIGLRLRIDYASDDAEVPVVVSGDLIKKGIWLDNLNDPRWDASYPDSPLGFDDFVTPELLGYLRAAADSEGHLFTDDADAEDFLYNGDLEGPFAGSSAGSIVYLESESAVEISGNSQIGTIDRPVVVVIDVPDGTSIGWDQRGTADFFGIIIVLGNIEVRGTSGVYGGMIASGDIESRGLGNTWEINYNERVFDAIRRTDHVISVNIVPNTWEEYTLPRTPTTVAGP